MKLKIIKKQHSRCTTIQNNTLNKTNNLKIGKGKTYNGIRLTPK